jgi:hypothetical protein
MTAKTQGFQRRGGHRITSFAKDGPALARILTAVPACGGSRFHQGLIRYHGFVPRLHVVPFAASRWACCVSTKRE